MCSVGQGLVLKGNLQKGGLRTVQYILSTCSCLADNITFALQKNMGLVKGCIFENIWSRVDQGMFFFNLLVRDWSRAQKMAKEGRWSSVGQVLVKEESKIHVDQVLAKIVKRGGVFGIFWSGVT